MDTYWEEHNCGNPKETKRGTTILPKMSFHTLAMQNDLTLVRYTTPITDVQQKIIYKRSSQEEKNFLWIFIEIVENWKPLGYYYKCTRQDVFCILIPQLLKLF